jgi:transposase-like protein
MPAERTTMRHVREVLRLKFVGGVATREIARRIGVAASTVRVTIRRFQAAGLSWPPPGDMTDAALEARLFDASSKQGHRRQVEPDWASIHREAAVYPPVRSPLSPIQHNSDLAQGP